MSENKVTVKVVNKSNHNLPSYACKGDAGVDLKANLDSPISIKPLERVLIPTGLYIKLPEGYELQIRPRSGNALKKGLTVLNTPGTIDENYIGPIGVILINLSSETQIVNPGDRIAQAVLKKVSTIEWEEVKELPKTERGDGGFGHSGN